MRHFLVYNAGTQGAFFTAEDPTKGEPEVQAAWRVLGARRFCL